MYKELALQAERDGRHIVYVDSISDVFGEIAPEGRFRMSNCPVDNIISPWGVSPWHPHKKPVLFVEKKHRAEVESWTGN